jgi:two-component system phosphate regulon sensor histidine kinase PhoR
MKRRPSLVWRLFPVHFLTALVSVAVVSVLAVTAFSEFYYAQVERDLKIRARLVGRELAQDGDLRANRRELERFVRSLDRCCQTRITVISPTGEVLADSRREPGEMENHSDRPEFKESLKGRVGTARRRSPTLATTMIYSAAPVQVAGNTVMVVRTSLPASSVDDAPVLTYLRFAIGAVIATLFSGLISLMIARRICEPIKQMEQAAKRFASGDLQARALLPDTRELASLAETLNGAASELAQQIRTVTQQAREQQAIMSSMKECVIAVDNDHRILLLNPAAEELLGVKLDAVRQKGVQEAIRNSALQNLLGGLSTSWRPATEEITFRGSAEDRVFQAVAAPLLDADEQRAGVVVVLNDITQTRKLENVRRDFVANVSHELKTPITAIKGYVETLQNGAINKPKDAMRFLNVVAAQTNRLNAIIDDLLALSKVEQSTEASQIQLTRSSVCPILEAARMSCLTRAAEQDIEIDIESECYEGLCALINGPLLEQAVNNLVDNAIKYSRKGGRVAMRADAEGHEIAIRVIDHGQGIEPEDLPRIFERFYRADKARSKRQPGTGLGLAIVKHIVQAHNGRVTVESTPGKGSTFTIWLPAV